MAASRDLGEFIRELRNNARISLRQLADQAGVSNPYLSQIERGLRKPSAEVLQQIANALRVSTPLMYLRAGLLAEREGQGVLAAIAADPDLTDRHKKTLVEIYEAFRRENARTREDLGEPIEDIATPSIKDVDSGSTNGPALDGSDTTPDAAAGDTPADSAAPGANASRPADRPTRKAARKTVRRTVKKTVRKAATRTADKPVTGDQKEMP
ncbi:MAG: helix-turn-helix domain-containing protein [Micromonosporaceae bacterium]